MLTDKGCCAGSECGCRLSQFPTSRGCPVCGKKVRLVGRAQLAEFRLSCPGCGYQSRRLSQEELCELL